MMSNIVQYMKNPSKVEDIARQLFSKYDTNNSGAIDPHELQNMLVELEIPLNELEGAGKKAENVIKYKSFLHADLNGDNKIDFQEFVHYFNSVLLDHFRHQHEDKSDESNTNRGEYGKQYYAAKAPNSVPLRDINLGGIAICDQGMPSYVDVIAKGSRSCERLILSNCTLGEHSIKLLCHLLIRKKFDKLWHLDLRENEISMKSAKYIAVLVSKCRTIRELLVDFPVNYNSCITKDGHNYYLRILAQLKHNKRRFGMHQHEEEKHSVPTIKQYQRQKNAKTKANRGSFVRIKQKKVEKVAQPVTHMAALLKVKQKHARAWLNTCHARKKQRQQMIHEGTKDMDLYSNEHEFKGIEYRLQGDPDMYTDEALAQRNLNKNHPIIQQVIQKWWDCLILPHFDRDRDFQINKMEYFAIHRALNHVLSENTVPSEESMQVMAHEDWESDRQGNSFIDSRAFTQSFMELADLWTESTDPQEYIDFLEFLFSSIYEYEFQDMVATDLTAKNKIRSSVLQQRQDALSTDKRSLLSKIKESALTLFLEEKDIMKYADMFQSDSDMVDRATFSSILSKHTSASTYCIARLFDLFNTSLTGVNWREFCFVSKLAFCPKETALEHILGTFSLGFELYQKHDTISRQNMVDMVYFANDCKTTTISKTILNNAAREIWNVEEKNSEILTRPAFIEFLTKNSRAIKKLISFNSDATSSPEEKQDN